ncbi:MAG: TIGR02449 family protein [Candidatus Competibacteraceae bacterium]|nr:TIGR02449 family protein [Candidatus Competibacteraceae bacterium]
MEIEELYENTVPAEADLLDDVTETAASGMAILTERVERLIRLCEKLSRENQTLRAQNLELQVERDELREKN